MLKLRPPLRPSVPTRLGHPGRLESTFCTNGRFGVELRRSGITCFQIAAVGVASVCLIATPKPSAVLELLGFGRGERNRRQTSTFRRLGQGGFRQADCYQFLCLQQNTTIAVNHCTRVVLIETSS